jgi:S-adenosylmethionine-diacylglycerol 3-amino-3-carboxypropyl transferase
LINLVSNPNNLLLLYKAILNNMEQVVNYLSSLSFNWIHSKNLVYNTCWEDPRCDRQLLDLQKDSKVVMITSAGCNALDYLLDSPAEIHCVDMNARQNALLELKKASFDKYSSHNDLFDLFGNGKHADAKEFYWEVLRPKLPTYSQQYWDKNIHFFDGKGLRKSFYHHGTSGIFAYTFGKYMKFQRKFFDKIERLMNAQTIDEQRFIYEEIEPKLFNQMMKWLMNRHLVMCMLGVPQAQQELFMQRYEHGAMGFIQSCLKKVFTEISIQDNYFYRVYINGAYSTTCCPNYLRAENYEAIGESAHKIKSYTTTLSDFLIENPAKYSHFVLLDHQDWLANHQPKALEEEWRLILENSQVGTKILLRSASENVNFFPDFVKEKVIFEQEKTKLTHGQDRVGTYASVYLGEVS